MHGTPQGPEDAHLSFGWQEGSPEPGDQSLERAAAFAVFLTRTLVADGYEPRRLDVGLRRGAGGVLEMRVHGDVPRMAMPEFGRVARATLHAVNLAHDIDDTDDVVLWAMLDTAVGAADTPTSPEPAQSSEKVGTLPSGRLASGSPQGRVANGSPQGRVASGSPQGGLASGLPLGRLASELPQGRLASGSPPGRLASEPLGRLASSVQWGRLAAGLSLGRLAASLQRGRLATGLPLGRLAVGLLVGLALGVLGLPRLGLPFLASSTEPTREVGVVQDAPTPAPLDARSLPVLPTPTIANLRTAASGQLATPSAPTATPSALAATISALSATSLAPTAAASVPTAAPSGPLATPSALAATSSAPTTTPSGPRVLFAERFVSPLPTWPNNPDSTAWFDSGGFRLFAREPGHFVAVGVPLAQPVGSAVVSAQFHKVGGPAGGGYGLIVRDQGSVAQRDGRSQAGPYIVLEVGDRGDVGIWQRTDTGWIDVLPWTHSEAVHTEGEPNALVVTMRASGLRFEVNGQVVGNLTYDGIPTQGGVGVFVGGDLNQVDLEWLRIEVS